jgi:signal transduction histidine kinase
LDRVKNTLLHAVSHDLRGPITSVLGSAATLERADELGLSQQDRAELLGGLSAGARKMHALVSSLLDLDRLDRGIVTPKREITDLGALVERVVDELGFASDRTLHREIDHLEMAIDAPKIERIVENLIGNAVKHTPRGTEAWVKVEPFEAGALISVEDAGPGVPEELRESIFEPFKQGPADSPGGSGVGIGLSLVASFAELHGGRAWVGERDGGGASFKVYIPDGEPEPDAAETVDGESHS